MDRDSVIKMAKESGMDDWTNDGNWSAVDDDLIRFANLVWNHALEEAALACMDRGERNRCANMMPKGDRDEFYCADDIRAMKVGAGKTAI